MHPVNQVTLKCKVKDIIEHLDVDITNVDVGSSLHAGEIELPGGFELASDPDDVLASIIMKKEEAEGEAAEVAEGEGAEPEVITERKAEDEEGKAE